jgi:uroporphyrin-III C-methyltransferase / precorrin-2 dehydrogenase / sirohydrochlorin ferrochelatase
MRREVIRKPVAAATPRMEALARLPLFFALGGKRAIVAGGSPAAAWKAELLAAAGACVGVYAADPCEELCSLESDASHAAVMVTRREWAAGDLPGAAIAVGAFDSDAEAGRFAEAARAAGIPVNVVDRPAFCDFSFGAIVNRSPLVVGISTDGAAPVFAQAVRAKIEALLPQGFSRWAGAAAAWRSQVKASGLSFAGRRKFWHLFTAQATAHPNRPPSPSDFDALIVETKNLGGAVEHGSVTLVGAGPGDPELLTLRAVRALQSADAILFDDLVSPEILDFARREARKILVGKTGHAPSCKQDEINALMVKLAEAGRRVVRLKGGDPLIFARADEEIDACRAAGIAVEIVPGITAVQGAAASLGVPLTGRDKASRLQLITGHAKGGGLPSNTDWNSVADPATTTALYMPSKMLEAFVAHSMSHGLDARTPTVAVARATRGDERRIATRVADLPDAVRTLQSGGPLLVMIGRMFETELSDSLAFLKAG